MTKFPVIQKQRLLTAFTPASVPAALIFPVHEAFKIEHRLCVDRQLYIPCGIHGRSAAWERPAFVTIVTVNPPALLCVGCHVLVEWFALIFTMRNKHHSDSKPFTLYRDSKCLTFIPLMPVREIAELFQWYLVLL